MRRITNWWRSWEVTIDSTWITTALMAVLVVASSAGLIREIQHFIMGDLVVRPPASADLPHSAAVAGSILRQIAFTVLVVAVLQWFKSVVRWVPRSHSGVDNS